jgi:hypothetical protein
MVDVSVASIVVRSLLACAFVAGCASAEELTEADLAVFRGGGTGGNVATGGTPAPTGGVTGSGGVANTGGTGASGGQSASGGSSSGGTSGSGSCNANSDCKNQCLTTPCCKPAKSCGCDLFGACL